MSIRKKIVLSIIGALLLLLALGVLLFPIQADYIRTEAHFNSRLRLPTLTTTDMVFSGRPNYVRFSENGNIYILCKDGILKEQTEIETKTIATDVHAMLPAKNGVLYTVTNTLYLAQQGKITEVAKNVDSFSYNSSDIIYSTNRGSLYAWRQGNSRHLAELSDNHTEQILANDTFTVWIGSNDILCFDDKGNPKELPIYSGSSNQYFLYQNYLVIVGEGITGAVAYHLETMEIQEIDFGWNTNEHDNRISVICNEYKLYLSIHSELWPELGGEIRTATFCVDPQTWYVERISEKFYDSLAFSDNRLYGLATSRFINEWELLEP